MTTPVPGQREKVLIKLGNYLLAHQDVIDASWTAKVIEEARAAFESEVLSSRRQALEEVARMAERGANQHIGCMVDQLVPSGGTCHLAIAKAIRALGEVIPQAGEEKL